ncbi:MAG: hypothetical protein K2X03_13665 [Bryobacteraceae bacterium]|nr:hypothetical protein [Bryobacteraceae bacterium]
MDIDERLAKLAERHDALAGTVELHDHNLIRLEHALDRLEATTKDQQEMLKHQQEMLADLRRAVDQIVVRVLGNHEDRIERLGRPLARRWPSACG